MKFSSLTDSFYHDLQKAPGDAIDISREQHRAIMAAVNGEGFHKLSHDSDGNPIVIDDPQDMAKNGYKWAQKQLLKTDKFATVDRAGLSEADQALVLAYREQLRNYATVDDEGNYSLRREERPTCSVKI